jgi:hypothetical protein
MNVAHKKDKPMREQWSDEDEQDAATVDALHALATATKIEPLFAATLEARLRQRAQQLAPQAQPWWQRLWRANWLTAQPSRQLQFGLAGLMLALVLLFATTPVARATLWGWLYSFGLVEATNVADQPMPLEHAELLPTRSMTLDEIQAATPFAITTPTWLPTELNFTGGFVEVTASGATQATLSYHLPSQGEDYAAEDPLLFILISNGDVEAMPLLDEAQVVPVRLDKIVGMYAHGGWASQSAVTADSTTVEGVYWDKTQDTAWLSWQIDGLNYLLYAQGLGVQEEEMVAMTLSMIVK